MGAGRGEMGAPVSKTYRPFDRKQLLLMPPSLDDWLPQDHLARFLSDVVDELDLSGIYESYEREGRGFPPYEPGMMTQVMLYAYCVGVPSSRKIEKRMVEDVAFRYLGAGNTPDFRTIAEFRRRHLEALERLFVQVLRLCQEAGLVKLGHVALDSTKIKANASKHKAMSYERMVKTEAQLTQQIQELLKQAEQVDQEEDRKWGADRRGDEWPAELARRESRLTKIREAKQALEQKAQVQAQQKRQERQKLEQEAQDQGRKVGGTPPEISDRPEPKAQRNFTDPESGILKGADGYIQGYNCQAAVDAQAQVIVACDVSASGADSVQMEPMLQKIQENVEALPKRLSADAGYFSEDNVKVVTERGVDPHIAVGRDRHGKTGSGPPRGRIPDEATVKERMKRKLQTKEGRGVYSRRKVIVEPVFGQIKDRGHRQFRLRGRRKVRAEWSLICTSHNLLKLFRALHGQWSLN